MYFMIRILKSSRIFVTISPIIHNHCSIQVKTSLVIICNAHIEPMIDLRLSTHNIKLIHILSCNSRTRQNRSPLL